MRSILVPIDEGEALSSTLQSAVLIAEQWGSYLEGLYVRLDVAGAIAVMGMGSPVLIEDFRRDEWVRVQEAHAQFDRFLADRKVRVGGAFGNGPTARFRAEAPPGEAFVGQHARLFDLTVLAQAGRDRPSKQEALLETVLFESGRPILLAPPMPPERLGETIVVAWNGSTETARTLAFARPFLERAKRTVVLSVEGGMVDGPSGEEVVEYLGRTGITAEPRHVLQHHGIGETILEEARRLEADLLVKGAYTQSRLRQMVFGGATRLILSMAHLPVLMAH
ncbi:MAG TPA: universal stress protein [Azospirillum sp.]|nr:universal stress protein [Azospirillum sp.]